MSTPKYQLHGSFPSKAGDSAYQVAQKNGFKGSEAEWLASLQGPQGDPGSDFIVTITLGTDGTTYTPDKSYTEVLAAYNSGRSVRCVYKHYSIPIISILSTGGIVYGGSALSESIAIVHSSTNTVDVNTLAIPSTGITFVEINITDDGTISTSISCNKIWLMILNKTSEPILVKGAGSRFYRYTKILVSKEGEACAQFDWSDETEYDRIILNLDNPPNSYRVQGNLSVNHQGYFDITDDGVLSLKVEYRGSGNTSYPYSVGNGSELDLPENLILPESVSNIKVVSLAQGMFYGNKRVKEITIPTTVTELPMYFCREATNLRAVHGTEHITSLGQAAFMSTKIKQVLCPNLLTLNAGVFLGSAYLEIVDIGKVTTIPNQVFANCALLREVAGGDSVSTIGAYAFYYTRSLRDLPLLSHVTSVDDYAFFCSRICTSLVAGNGISAKAFPTADNNADFWSGVKYTPCCNRLTTKLSQSNPEWKDENVLLDSSAITYNNACTIFVIMHIHSAITGKYYSDPREFVNELASDDNLSKYLYGENWPGEFENVSTVFESLGYRTEVHGIGDDNNLSSDDYRALVDALASGAYVYAQVGVKSYWDNEYYDGGHAVVIYGINEFGEVCVLDSLVLHEYCREAGFEPDADIYTYTMPYQNLVGPSSNFVIVYPPNVEPDAGTVDLTGYIKAPATAEVGQTIVVKAVDDNGKPTEWEAADMASGSGGDLKHIKTINLGEEVSTITIDTDADGNSFELKNVILLVSTIGGTQNTGKANYAVYVNKVDAGVVRATASNGVYASGSALKSIVEYNLLGIGTYRKYVSINGTPNTDSFGVYGNDTSIRSLTVYVGTDGFTFGVGTTIEVYGVSV